MLTITLLSLQTDGVLIRFHDNPPYRPAANRELHGHDDNVIYSLG